MKRLLIISPYFPPANAADMQRVRTSLPFFSTYGWEAEVVTVDLSYIDINTDDLLSLTIPPNIPVHYVKAFSKSFTSKFGLGSIALRSLWFYKKKVNELLAAKPYHLIYFSTTQFPVCVLGAYWKKRFKVPYVIDMQDPWHSDYYRDKPQSQRPQKYWFSYNLNKYMEPVAIKNADGLISVSPQYITDLKQRYPVIKDVPSATITFGIFDADAKIAQQHLGAFNAILNPAKRNLVYIGRGGNDMHAALKPLFITLQHLHTQQPEICNKLKIYFIGTSYAAKGQGRQTILPLAQHYGLNECVIELTDRISYYHTLATLQQADALLIPGSDDAKYTASKIYPYLLSQKPILALLHPDSPAINTLKGFGVDGVYAFDDQLLAAKITSFLTALIQNSLTRQVYEQEAIKKHSADNLTKSQCEIFDLAVNHFNKNRQVTTQHANT